jgi:hypothetical protein
MGASKHDYSKEVRIFMRAAGRSVTGSAVNSFAELVLKPKLVKTLKIAIVE